LGIVLASASVIVINYAAVELGIEMAIRIRQCLHLGKLSPNANLELFIYN